MNPYLQGCLKDKYFAAKAAILILDTLSNISPIDIPDIIPRTILSLLIISFAYIFLYRCLEKNIETDSIFKTVKSFKKWFIRQPVKISYPQATLKD
jgi:hypothetical protein